jgi:hypothetical protein
MNKTKVTPTLRQRRTETAKRFTDHNQKSREHGERPDSTPNYPLRRLAAIATLATVVWNGAEATDYGDKIPAVKDVKDGAEFVVDNLLENIDQGPSNPEVVNEEWRKYQQGDMNSEQGPARISNDGTN